MKYFWTFFWTFLLAQMMTYVVGSMNKYQYNFDTGLKLAIGMTILILLIPALLPEENTNE